jgi:hypothetical protein
MSVGLKIDGKKDNYQMQSLVFYPDFIFIAMQGSFSIYLKFTGLSNASAISQLGHICPSSMRIAK